MAEPELQPLTTTCDDINVNDEEPDSVFGPLEGAQVGRVALVVASKSWSDTEASLLLSCNYILRITCNQSCCILDARRVHVTLESA